ncbi:hypothetical protein FPOAC2_10541 [Fusarium poae]
MSSAKLHTKALIYQKATTIDLREDKSIKQQNHYKPKLWNPIIRDAVLTIGACISTAISIIIPTLFETSTSQQSCLGSFPTCDPKTLITPSFLPSFLHPAFTCEALLATICVAICIQWTCVSLLFQQARWRERYFPMVTYTVGGATILAAHVVKDPATVFIQVLPLVSDICSIICLGLDCISP